MTPMVIHRYSISALEAVRSLLDIGDCQEIQIVMVGENLVIDVLEPAGREAIAEPPSIEPPEEPETPPPQPPARKGGPLAQKAGILCNEGAFQLWADVKTPETAKAFIYQRCGIESRVDLDHEDEPARKFKDLCVEYQVWLELP